MRELLFSNKRRKGWILPAKMSASSRRAYAGDSVRQMGVQCTTEKLKTLSLPVLQQYMRVLDQYFQDFSDAHNQVLNTLRLDDDRRNQAGVFVEIQLIYVAVRAQLNAQMMELSLPPDQSELLTASTTSTPRVNIPSIGAKSPKTVSGVATSTPPNRNNKPSESTHERLGKFHGNAKQWPDFREKFIRLVHSLEIDPIFKFQYLVKALDGRAADVAGPFKPDEKQYFRAWQALQDFYDHPTTQMEAYVDELYSFPKLPAGNRQAVIRLRERLQFYVRQAEALGEAVRSWSPVLIVGAGRILDEATASSWAVQPRRESIHDFLEFLSRRERVLLEREQKHAASGGLDAPLKAPTKKEQYEIPCAHCKGRHATFKCPGFLSLSLNERWSYVRQERLCPNCLHPGHDPKRCYHISCQTCETGDHHNSVLCRLSPAAVAASKRQRDMESQSVNHPPVDQGQSKKSVSDQQSLSIPLKGEKSTVWQRLGDAKGSVRTERQPVKPALNLLRRENPFSRKPDACLPAPTLRSEIYVPTPDQASVGAIPKATARPDQTKDQADDVSVQATNATTPPEPESTPANAVTTSAPAGDPFKSVRPVNDGHSLEKILPTGGSARPPTNELECTLNNASEQTMIANPPPEPQQQLLSEPIDPDTTSSREIIAEMPEICTRANGVAGYPKPSNVTINTRPIETVITGAAQTAEPVTPDSSTTDTIVGQTVIGDQLKGKERDVARPHVNPQLIGFTPFDHIFPPFMLPIVNTFEPFRTDMRVSNDLLAPIDGINPVDVPTSEEDDLLDSVMRDDSIYDEVNQMDTTLTLSTPKVASVEPPKQPPSASASAGRGQPKSATRKNQSPHSRKSKKAKQRSRRQ